MLKKENRLSRLSSKKEGKYYESPLFKIKISDTINGLKFAFIVSKKIDKRAVVRNKTKRVLKKAVKEILEKISKGKEIIIISKQQLDFNQKDAVEKSLEEIFKQAKILK